MLNFSKLFRKERGEKVIVSGKIYCPIILFYFLSSQAYLPSLIGYFCYGGLIISGLKISGLKIIGKKTLSSKLPL